jgi:hypothetical protein
MAYMLARPHAPGLRLGPFAAQWYGEGGLERVQHLWFILVLLLYSLALGPVFSLLRRYEPVWLGRLLAWSVNGGLRLLLVPALPLTLVLLYTKPWLAGDTGAGHTFWLYGLYFLSGYLIMGAGQGFQRNASRVWPVALGAGLLAGIAYLILLGEAEKARAGLALMMDQGGWARAGIAAYSPWFLAALMLDALSSWWLTLAAFGLASRYLTRPSPLLSSLNQAVYPFYVLHMIFVSAGVIWAVHTGWPWGIELVVIILASYAACWLGYLGLRMTRLTRFLFAIKPRVRPSA